MGVLSEGTNERTGQVLLPLPLMLLLLLLQEFIL